MRITRRPFGKMPDGTEVSCFELTNENGLSAEVLDYGAIIRSIIVPDKHQRAVDVVLGYDTLEEYLANGGCFGATVGRFANRIGSARFELNGMEYTLAANNGANHLHGGLLGFHKRVWRARECEDGLCLRLTSPDGEEGYPGTLELQLTIAWEGNGLALRYRATCDADTILNLTNHSYFNLDEGADINAQLLQIWADQFTANDEFCLPTGEIASVEGTAMDFRKEKPIGRDADRDESYVRHSCGYDTNFILRGDTPAARARSLRSGIVMTMATDQPGVQLYTANNMKPRRCKGGRIYGHRAGFCLETQHYPDCIHHAEWPSCILRKGDVFESRTVYGFVTEE